MVMSALQELSELQIKQAQLSQAAQTCQGQWIWLPV